MKALSGRTQSPKRLAGDGLRGEVERRAHALEERADAAGGEEVLHVALARRLQVDEHRRLVGEAVEVVEVEPQPEPSRHGGKMHDGVGRARDREQRPDRVVDAPLSDDPVDRPSRADEVDGGAAGGLGGAQPVGVHGRDRRRAGQHQAEHLDQDRHRRRRAHHGAGALGRREPALDGLDLVRIDAAGAVFRPEAPAVGAGAQPLAAVARGHHRPGGEHDRRLAGRRRAHDERRQGLVAAADEHDRIHRLAADHLLGRHRHEVAVEHAGRRQEHLAERDDGEVERQRAGGKHAAFDGLDELRHAAMAVVEAAGRLGDADHRLCQELARIAHRARERAPQIGGESRIAVVGEPAFEALAFALRHGAHPCTKALQGSNGFTARAGVLAALAARGFARRAPRKRGAREAWSVLRVRRTCAREGGKGKEARLSEPNQTSRAALLVPGLALRRQPAARPRSGASAP